jgi:protein involved in polysaccharide export with SLBB domain
LAQRQALDRLRTLRPAGRIALDLPADETNVLGRLPALRLESGDRLIVASRPDFVYIFGSVNTESALVHRPGKTVADYLEQSGLGSGADRDNVILLRADGSALTNSSNWGNTVLRKTVMPGDTIVLPEKVDRETGWSFFVRNTKDFTQIFYQLGLGAAALKTLRQ